MKKRIIIPVAVAIFCLGFKTMSDKQSENTIKNPLDFQETAWVSLFDGKTLNGWHGYLSEKATDAWAVENGHPEGRCC